MKFVAISDTHQLHERIYMPEGDVLIHAGDFCNYGTLLEVRAFADWLSRQDYQHKVVIAGNHDWPFARQGQETEARFLLMKAGVAYLQDTELNIDGIRIYGSPWQPEFCNWAFNLKRGSQLKEKWDKIPEGIDILITHGPPFGVRDELRPVLANDGGPLGCKDLAGAVNRIQPRVHVFGHIHPGYGVSQDPKAATKFINAAICNEEYEPVNKPIIFNLEAKPNGKSV